MTIEVECSSCGKVLRVKDSNAGKRGKCPSCGEVVQIPELEEDYYEAEVVDDGGDEWDEAIDSGDDDRVPCSMCGEMIKANASKCRFCGEVFDEDLKQSERKKKRRKKRGGRYAADDEDMTTGDWIVAVICSGIGCIAGIVWMIQGKPKGTKMFAVSFGFVILWNVVRLIFAILNGEI